MHSETLKPTLFIMTTIEMIGWWLVMCGKVEVSGMGQMMRWSPVWIEKGR